MDQEFLRKVSLFNQLDDRELNIFSEKLTSVNFREGDKIITDHQESDNLYILYSGSVIISKKMSMIENQEELDKTFTVLNAEAHPFFGEIGLLGFRKRTANVTADSDCLLYTINQEDFMKISREYPRIGFKVLLEISRKLSEILEKTNEDVLKLTTALIYALK
ncbi:MAG: cyclic nucleotide-binding domain-containing protein [Candidatus Cloacimonetes bacterium]|nr:cyclic nucleotide-binding domain-containing protein [Candidatus Cloacimonadota bacterium]